MKNSLKKIQKKGKVSRHRPADLLQNQKHCAVPRAQAREVGGEALVERGDAAVPGGLDEAVHDARVESRVG